MLRSTLDTLHTDAQVIAQSDKVFGPGDVFARQAVAELISRQSMAGTVDDYLPGYKKEITNILRRRMTLRDPKQAYSVRSANALGKMGCCLNLREMAGGKAGLYLTRDLLSGRLVLMPRLLLILSLLG